MFFDNGCVHNLLVGSEPTHCSYYPFLCISMLLTCYPTFGGVKPLLLHIVTFIVSYPWWGDAFMFILLLLYLLLSYSRA